MSRAKVVTLHNNRFQGNYLTDSDCDKLELIIEAREEGKSFEDLKHVICDLSPEDVEAIKDAETGYILDEKPEGTLRDYQTVSVAYGLIAKRWLSGDSVGLGKTVEIPAIIRAKEKLLHKTSRVLILTQDILLAGQVRDEFIRFTGDFYEVHDGTKKSIDQYLRNVAARSNNGFHDVFPNVVATYSILNQKTFQEYVRAYKEETGEDLFDFVVCDESAVLMNQKTALYKTADDLFKDVQWKICLNATEFDTSLLQFYNQLAWLDPTLLPTRTAFTRKYCVMKRSNFTNYPVPSGRYQNADEFRHGVGYRYFANTRRDLNADIRGNTAEIILARGNTYLRNLLKKTSMPELAVNCPWAIDLDALMTPAFCPKLAAFTTLVSRVVTTRQNPDGSSPQILVYVNHKQSQTGVSKMLNALQLSHEILNGDTEKQERFDMVDRFKAGVFDVLITNISRGLNFDNVDNIIFYEFPSVSRAVQFEGRMTRSLDILNKHLYVILSECKELNKFRGILAERANAVTKFSNADYSLILNLLSSKGAEEISKALNEYSDSGQSAGLVFDI